MSGLYEILSNQLEVASSQRKGRWFEKLIKAYLFTDPKYAELFKNVWLWEEFPFRESLGGQDTGIDMVAQTYQDEYWAIQCKFWQEDSCIDKQTVDSFLATSSRQFHGEEGNLYSFAHRLWISTSNNWSTNAEQVLKNQKPPVSRIHLEDLAQAPVDWQKLVEGITGKAARKGPKQPMPHQMEAVQKAQEYFQSHTRGKLIMACGTGKTFTSLRIAEVLTHNQGLILFLVPSISLLSQTLNEWYADAQEPIYAICICSDPEVSRKRNYQDSDMYSVIDLALPASTNVESIYHQFQAIPSERKGMVVVFSTYQSIDVIAQVQQKLAQDLPHFAIFDMIICDEAHRTTGVALAGEEESAFIKVHNDDFIRARRRLYMTATPRLYHESAKARAAQAEAILCSMDDSQMYGKEFYRLGFGEAVEKGLLTDYKVLILKLSERDVPPAVRKILADENNQIPTDDLSKLVGCINGLSKQIVGDDGIILRTDPTPMKRAVAFCQSIIVSKKISQIFNAIKHVYINSLPPEKQEYIQVVAAEHIDGSMGATKRNELLNWLKKEENEKQTQILCNVRCLSEGIDVPSLDAVLFLSPRNSQVDVVQSVGRVMRKAPGKKYGYIIIPVVIPIGVEPHVALENNEKYKVVWTVLNALRAHDDRFNAIINKIELNRKKPEQILIGGAPISFDEQGQPIEAEIADTRQLAKQLAFDFPNLQSVFLARLVQKVGDRRYWEEWAQSVAEIAKKQIEKIEKILEQNLEYQSVFADFLQELRVNLNPSVSQAEAIELLAQHIITKPVFDALFEDYSFAQYNPVSRAMQKILDILQAQAKEKDLEELEKFYDSVRKRASGIDNAEGKQKIIIELYDKFFKTAFPKMADRLGIVYTPIEVVDFILHSVNDILLQEFGVSLSQENVHILDPFTGTGTFIVRLLQSGLIAPGDLERKYKYELHANEIVLLAYYIAAINIENVYHDIAQKREYEPFPGICFTDTFQLTENIKKARGAVTNLFFENSFQVQNQQQLCIRVIIGNPPYSVGQRSANDNAQNQEYPDLESRIAETYVKESDAVLKASLYDSYIKAFRWSSDRLSEQEGGIICFVSNGAWLDGNSAVGFRKCIEKEFSSIYVFNLRGNQRTSGEISRKEGGKIFGSGSRTPIAITLLVKKPKHLRSDNNRATIYYRDIGDYLKREEKLKIIKEFKSFANPAMELTILKPNAHGDWISQRDQMFEIFIPLAPEERYTSGHSFFVTYSMGVATSRDAWVYNFSKQKLINNVQRAIDFYNSQVDLYAAAKAQSPHIRVEDVIDWNMQNFKWDVAQLKSDLPNGRKYTFDNQSVVLSLYRPFTKQFLYFNRKLNNRVYQLPKLFPDASSFNLVICVTGGSATKDFSTMITNFIPNQALVINSQAFPLYYYEESTQGSLYEQNHVDNHTDFQYTRKEGVTDWILERAWKQYGNNCISKEDIFYYVYGFLHSLEYRERFKSDLKKSLPRIPLVAREEDFWAFSQAGRKLADLHLNYESIPFYPDVVVQGGGVGYF
ncbi:MAG: type ISP restriction/modification enzyme [Bacteroidia bacterium]|nr:type ISP restriction/modification enzyme [Bacteroidia bacterium]